MFDQVSCSSTQKLGSVFVTAKPGVAKTAKKCSDFACFWIVIYMKVSSILSWLVGSAYSALTVLTTQHFSVNLHSNTVVLFEECITCIIAPASSPLYGFSVNTSGFVMTGLATLLQFISRTWMGIKFREQLSFLAFGTNLFKLSWHATSLNKMEPLCQ